MKCYTCGKSDPHQWGLKCPRKTTTEPSRPMVDRITYEYISELVQAAGRYTSDDFEWWFKSQLPQTSWQVYPDTASPLDAVVHSVLGFMPADDVMPLGNLGGGVAYDDLIDY